MKAQFQQYHVKIQQIIQIDMGITLFGLNDTSYGYTCLYQFVLLEKRILCAGIRH